MYDLNFVLDVVPDVVPQLNGIPSKQFKAQNSTMYLGMEMANMSNMKSKTVTTSMEVQVGFLQRLPSWHRGARKRKLDTRMQINRSGHADLVWSPSCTPQVRGSDPIPGTLSRCVRPKQISWG